MGRGDENDGGGGDGGDDHDGLDEVLELDLVNHYCVR